LPHTINCLQGGCLRLCGLELLDVVTSLITRGASVRFRAHGLSMLPFIRDGDVVTLVPVQDRPVRIGDVVAIRNSVGNNLILHRVVRKMPGGYLIQGDNAAVADGIFPARAVLALVKRVERDGRGVRFSQGWSGMLIAACVGSGFMKRWNLYRGLTGGALWARAKQAAKNRLGLSKKGGNSDSAAGSPGAQF
jgi:hypothetical protein